MIKTNLKKNQKLLLIVIAAFFAIIIIYSLATMIYRTGKTKVIIRIAPSEAKITLNDTGVGNNSTIWLEPGNYLLKVTFNEHFNDYEREINITNETEEIYATLSAADDEGREYINNHRQDYVTVEGLIGDLENREGEKKRKENPILNYLPINNSLYSISYTRDENSKLIINVKTELEQIDTVVAKMKTFSDVDLADQNIIFHNDNPLAKYYQNPQSDINKFLRTAFQLSANFVIDEIKQVEDYSYTTIHIEDYSRALSYAHYRVLLKKGSEDRWEIVATPQPILTTYNTPNIKKEILNTINSY